MIYIKSEKEIEKIKIACQIVAKCHEAVAKEIKAGMSTMDIEDIVMSVIKENGGIASCVGVEGFDGAKPYPCATCISINDEVIHGIPNKNRIIKDGDIVSIDLCAGKDGYHGDAARTYIIGEVKPRLKELVAVTEQAFYEGIKYAKEGYRISDISHAIGEYVQSCGFDVIREFQGHGVGRSIHEDPGIPNYGKPGRGARLEAGMTLAIEPMVVAGFPDIYIGEDGWTVYTSDGKYAAHYENTILITKNEPEILTKLI